LTDLTAQIQKKKIIKLWIQDHIDYLVSSEEVWAEKPDSRVFELSLEKLGLQKDQVCMIGDSYEKDILWAKKFGIHKLYHKIDENNMDENEKEWENTRKGEDQSITRFTLFNEIMDIF
jgi:putative hydrolase of the HAD superfamily